MSESVATVTQLTQTPNVDYSPAGLTISGELSFTEWETLGETLAGMNQCVAWWIGDWYNYGNSRWGERAAAARAISDAVTRETCHAIAPGTVQRYAYVASRFEIVRRSNNLTFGHHQAIPKKVRTGDANKLLARAEARNWTVAEMRAEAQKVVAKLPAPDSKPIQKFGILFSYFPDGFSETNVKKALAARNESATVKALCFLVCEDGALPAGIDALRGWGFQYESGLAIRHYRETAQFPVYNRHDWLLIGRASRGILHASDFAPESIITKRLNVFDYIAQASQMPGRAVALYSHLCPLEIPEQYDRL